MKVSEILQVKGNILYTVTPDQPLLDAANTMAEKDIGSLVVMEFGDLVGMLTFREVLNALQTRARSAAAPCASTWMTIRSPSPRIRK